MAATRRRKKRVQCKITESHIRSNEVGPRGLTCDETNVVYSLLWNQPSLQPRNSEGYWRKKSNPLVRSGYPTTRKSHSIGLPLFYTNTSEGTPEGGPISEDDERGKEEEIHELSLDTVQLVQPRRKRKRVAETMTDSAETDVSERVRSELSYSFPPVMSKMIEYRVQEKLREKRRRGMEHEKMYHKLLVDYQVFLAREIERKLISESHDNHMTSNDESSSSSLESSIS